MKSGRKVVKLARTVSPAFDEERIHKMRTTVKKMKALADWSGAQPINIFRKYYKSAGRIRNVQLLVNKIKRREIEVTPSFHNWLEERLHLLKVSWQQQFTEENISKQFKKLKRSLRGASRSKPEEFAVEKKNQLIHLKTNRPLSDEQIHSGRKTMKAIDYLNRWENKQSDESIKEISEATGNFMDTCSEIELLELYIDQETDPSKRDDATVLLSKWKNAREEQKIKLLDTIESLPG